MLATVINDHQNDWDLHLPRTLFAYRTSLHAATGFSPFHIVFGHSPTLPVDVMLGALPQQQPKDVPAYVSDLHKSLKTAYTTVRSHIQSAHERNKQRYDAAKPYVPYTVGDQVWLHVPAVKTGSRAAPILVSVSVSGQYQHFLAVSESVKYVTQVPILLLVYYTYY